MYIELEHSRAAIAAIREMVPDERVLLLSFPTGVKGASSEARADGNDPEFMAAVRAVAILAKNPVARMLGNFFIRLTRPSYPTKLFDEEERAVAWLLSP